MSLANIELQQRMISLESSTLSNALSAVTDRLPGYVSEVNAYVRSLLNLEMVKPTALLGKRETIDILKRIPYVSIHSTQVYTPPGLSVSYLELAHALEEAEKIASAVYSDVLAPFNKWLAIQLSSPERLISITSASVPGLRLHDTTHAVKALKHCFSGDSTTGSLPFGEAFKRSTDVATAAQVLNRISDHAARTTPQMVREAIETITGNLDRLIERMNADPETYKLSGSTVKALADVAYAMARECEFYSAFQYQLRATLKAFQDLEIKLVEDLTAGATHATSDGFAIESTETI